MKIRNGFVSNSSSSSFIITNLSNETKTLKDFVKENPQLIEEFLYNYDWYKPEDGYNQEEMVEFAEQENLIFTPNEEKYCEFSDECGILVQHVLRYVLRYGGKSENFEWRDCDEN